MPSRTSVNQKRTGPLRRLPLGEGTPIPLLRAHFAGVSGAGGVGEVPAVVAGASIVALFFVPTSPRAIFVALAFSAAAAFTAAVGAVLV